MPAIKPVTAGTPYQVPPEPNRWPAILLAVAVHAMLLGFLWFGISWQNNEPVAVEAEVWDMKVQAAAPTPPPPQEAEPQPQPQPETPPPREVVEQPAPPQVAPPDIALEREKKRKEEKLRKEQEQRELAEEKARDEAKAKELAKKEAEKKKDADKAKAEELAKQQEADRKAKDLADKKDAEKQAKLEKLAKAKADAAEKAKLDKLRDAEMKRMMAAADAGSGGTGTAAKSTAPRSDSGYVAAITSKVKSNTIYSGSTDEPGNPRVEFHVEQLPTGEIISVKKTKSSGIPAFDDAVEKGIIKASPLPKKKDGTVERSLEIGFKMKDVT
jgi:colicin import membrane protein